MGVRGASRCDRHGDRDRQEGDRQVGGSHAAHGCQEEEGQEGGGPEKGEEAEGQEAEEEEEEEEKEGQEEEEEEEKEEEEGRALPGRQAPEGPAQEQGGGVGGPEEGCCDEEGRQDRGHLRWRLDVQARRRREQAPEVSGCVFFLVNSARGSAGCETCSDRS